MNTKETRKLVDQLGAIAFQADMTRLGENPPREVIEAAELLEVLGNPKAQLPYLVIFPAGRPNNPIVFDNQVFQGDVLAALEEAGASRNVARSDEDHSEAKSPGGGRRR